MNREADYFLSGRTRDKREIKLTENVLDKAKELFPKAIIDERWIYEVFEGKEMTVPSRLDGEEKPSYSQSTNAMMLFSLIASANKASEDCPLIPKISFVGENNFNDHKKIYQQVWKTLLDNINEEYNKSGKGKICYSLTFGNNDPLTLTWILEIHKARAFRTYGYKDIIDSLINEANKRVIKIFDWKNDGSTSSPNWLEWDHTRRFCVDHAFLALRYIHLNNALAAFEKNINYPLWLKKYFDDRIYEQLSKFEIKDGGFDAAELVFALEGALLLKTETISTPLLERIFNVITESQKQNPYWRPVKPTIATPQGSVLFPLSVETATSLLRCCYLIEKTHQDPEFFSKHVELFRRYTGWLRSRMIKVTPKKGGKEVEFFGWRSEHVHLHPGIHVWETSSVMLYLKSYTEMLKKNLARRSLESANLIEEIPWDDNQKYSHSKYWNEERAIIEPFQDEMSIKLQPYRYAEEYFIVPRESDSNEEKIAFSVLLYGPPGTGKTVFAEEVSKALKWPLITVTPSDFIHGGESEVEARAKKIFEVLEDQYEKIILFDEIDRMILDRGSKGYAEQGDIFQFMTPSMLTKLRNLYKSNRVVFIIATNYKERIDPAAIRKGRIDGHLLMPPPDLKGRQKILRKLIESKLLKAHTRKDIAANREQIENKIETASKASSLFTYGEIKTVVDDTVTDKTKSIVDFLDSLIENFIHGKKPDETSLLSYYKRFNENNFREPFEEFLLLVYLKLEGGGTLESKERQLIEKVFSKLLSPTEKDLVIDWKNPEEDLLRNLKLEINKVSGFDKKFADLILDNFPL